MFRVFFSYRKYQIYHLQNRVHPAPGSLCNARNLRCPFHSHTKWNAAIYIDLLKAPMYGNL